MSRLSKIAPKQAAPSDQDLEMGLNQSEIIKAREARVSVDMMADEQVARIEAIEDLKARFEADMNIREAAPEAPREPVAAEPVATEPAAPREPVATEPVATEPAAPREPVATEPVATEPASPAAPDDFAAMMGRMRAILPPMPMIEEDSTPEIVMTAFRELKRSDQDFHEKLRLAAGEFATSAAAAVVAGNPGLDMGSPAAAAFRQNMGMAFAASGMSLLTQNGARTRFNDPAIDRIMSEHMDRFADRHPEFYRKVDPRQDPKWNDARAVPLDRIRLDSPGEASSAMRAYYAGGAVITNGDKPVPTLDPELSQTTPPPPPAPDTSFEARFPPKPDGWPKMQAWPQQPAYDLMKANDASDEEIRKYMEFIEERRVKMARRAEQIREYLLEHNDPEKMGSLASGYTHMRRGQKERGNQRDVQKYGDDHYGIKWAMLLNDNVKANALNITASWGFNTAATTDGGIVVALDESIKFQKISKQAIQLAMHEGMARGWGSFDMAGNKEFAHEAIAIARSMNMPAKITERYGPMGLLKRIHHITPAPPGSDEAPKVETEDLGAGKGKSMTHTPDGTDLREPGGLAAPRPDVPAPSLKKRPKTDPDLDRPYSDPPEPFEGDDPRLLVDEDPEVDTHLQMVNTGTPRPKTANDMDSSYGLG